MESERANLACQIQIQKESVEIKDAEMKKIREQIEQVKVRFTENPVFQHLTREPPEQLITHQMFAPSVVFRSSAQCLLTSALRSVWTTSESTSRST